MYKRLILGLTGGIATGKSTVSSMLRERGAVIIDADQVSREVVEPGSVGLDLIRKRFGDQMIDQEGKLNRTALGLLIFHDEQARKELNQLLHPLIIEQMQSHTKQIQLDKPNAIIIWDVPLLIEESLTRFVEKVIVVYIPEELQLIRLMERNHLTKEEAQARMDSQLSIEEKKHFANYLIDNSGSIHNTERQVDHLWNCLTLKNGSDQL